MSTLVHVFLFLDIRPRPQWLTVKSWFIEILFKCRSRSFVLSSACLPSPHSEWVSCAWKTRVMQDVAHDVAFYTGSSKITRATCARSVQGQVAIHFTKWRKTVFLLIPLSLHLMNTMNMVICEGKCKQPHFLASSSRRKCESAVQFRFFFFDLALALSLGLNLWL